MRILAITCVKNEAAFLLEWLAHHRSCGFTDFLVFSNACSDGTDAMLDRLAAMGQLTHIRNDTPHPEGPQWAALKAADKHPLMRAADWVLFCDIDEFVNIHVGNRSVQALLGALPDATAIALTWRMFGNAGVVSYTDAPVTETFTGAAPPFFGWPWRAQLFKTLFKNDGGYRKLGVHRPRSPDAARLQDHRWYDGSGRVLAASFHSGRIFSDYTRDNYALVQLNHYALGSMQGFVVKADRGRANREAGSFDMGYWVERNFSSHPDHSIAGLQSGALRAELHSDAVLRGLHAAAVQWRHSRFASLMQSEPWRAFFGRLLMTPPSRVLSPTEALQITRHNPEFNSER